MDNTYREHSPQFGDSDDESHVASKGAAPVKKLPKINHLSDRSEPNLDGPLQEHEIPLAHQFFNAQRLAVDGQLKAIEDYNSVIKHSRGSREYYIALAEFFRQNDHFADFKALPPTLTLWASDYLGSVNNGQPVTDYQSSLFPPRHVRSFNPNDDGEGYYQYTAEGAPISPLNLELRKRNVARQLAMIQGFIDAPIKPGTSDSHSGQWEGEGEGEQGDELGALPSSRPNRKSIGAASVAASVVSSTQALRFKLKNIDFVAAPGVEQIYKENELSEWELTYRNFTKKARLEAGLIGQYRRVHQTLHLTRKGHDNTLDGLSRKLQPLFGRSILSATSSSHPVNGRKFMLLRPMKLARALRRDRLPIVGRGPKGHYETPGSENVKHPADLALIRGREVKFLTESVNEKILLVLGEFIKRCGGLVVGDFATLNSAPKGHLVLFDAPYEYKTAFPEGTRYIEITDLKALVDGNYALDSVAAEAADTLSGVAQGMGATASSAGPSGDQGRLHDA